MSQIFVKIPKLECGPTDMPIEGGFSHLPYILLILIFIYVLKRYYKAPVRKLFERVVVSLAKILSLVLLFIFYTVSFKDNLGVLLGENTYYGGATPEYYPYCTSWFNVAVFGFAATAFFIMFIIVVKRDYVKLRNKL